MKVSEGEQAWPLGSGERRGARGVDVGQRTTKARGCSLQGGTSAWSKAEHEALELLHRALQRRPKKTEKLDGCIQGAGRKADSCAR